MADSKITALTAISTVDPTADPLVIVDVSDTSMAASGTTKKSTINQLLGSGGTATLASATITGDLTVDTSTLKVDSANNRVGIGTASPATDLHIFKSSATDNALIQLQNGTASSYIGTRGTTYGAVDAGDTYIFNSSGNDIVLMADNAAGAIKFAAGGNTESMRLNSTGLGVGDTPASNTRLTVAAASRLADTTGQAYIRSTDAQAQDIGAQFTLGGLFNASSHYAFGGIAGRKENSTSGNVAGYLDFLTTTSGGSLTSRMRIDSSGNVGIGVTPTNVAGYRKLEVGGTGVPSIVLSTNSSNASARNWATASNFNAFGDYVVLQSNALGGDPITAGTTRMTLDASGNLLVGTTGVHLAAHSAFQNNASGQVTFRNTSTTAGRYFNIGMESGSSMIVFNDAGVGVYLGYGTTSWGSTSDEKVKDIIEPISNAVAKVGSLRSVIGKFKTDSEGTRRSFLIAQDVQSVLPEAVDTSNADLLAVRYTEVIPLLVAAIKELTAEVNALKKA